MKLVIDDTALLTLSLAGSYKFTVGCVVTNFVTLDFLVFASSVSRVSIIRACTDHAQELRDCHFQFWNEQKLVQLLCGSIW